ncbi:MAG: hypothetical protein GWP10_19435 [Nitrospiraceae bacterium]|nr:hypothetical protein [Nitrospiraceae bacterium]
MNWAAQYSRSNGVRHIDQQAIASIKGFIFWREKIFSRLRAKNIDIPVRAKKRHSLLETLAGNAPEEFRSEIAALLRARERCIPYVVPALSQVAIAFLAKRLGISYFEARNSIPCTDFEETLALAVRQGIDRTDPDKVGIRVDFSALAPIGTYQWPEASFPLI